MKLRAWHWFIGVPAVILVFGQGVSELHARQDAAALTEQLRLARAEGLPTDYAEYAATMPRVPPDENAAPFYGKFHLASDRKFDADLLLRQLDFKRNPATLATAEAFMNRSRTCFDLIDEAVRRPHCRFDRNWSDGPAVLLPEYIDLKRAARYLSVRGSLAMRQGRVNDAITDVEKVFVIARQAGAEEHVISALSEVAIRTIGLSDLARWSFARPESKAYYKAYLEALKTGYQPHPKQMNRDSLATVLDIIDLASTPEGRAKLGLRSDENASLGVRIQAMFLSQPKARIEVVKVMRAVERA